MHTVKLGLGTLEIGGDLLCLAPLRLQRRACLRGASARLLQRAHRLLLALLAALAQLCTDRVSNR